MIATLLMAMALQSGPCVKAGEAGGAERAWYRNNEKIVFGRKKYAKFGLPRTGLLGVVEPIGMHDGVPVTAEKGVRARDIIYLLADTADCSLQPYQVEPQ